MKYFKDHFKELISASKGGRPMGIYSICSINRFVLKEALKYSLSKNGIVLIESTCNQVNQFGGYTGMLPVDFREYVLSIASETGFPKKRVIVGGDHIGPFPFRNESSSIAMEKARGLIKNCVEAGYKKIHIDASMPLKGDRNGEDGRLDKEIIAARCADLAKSAEDAFKKTGAENRDAPVYVIGTDIPSPGGSDEVNKGRRVTTVEDLEETVSLTRKHFSSRGLESVWERVIAVVVQPGVEHGDHIIIDYSREDARELSKTIKSYENLVFEAHTTDYQTRENLKKMVEDGFFILKIGPSLTNALKEAVFLLSYIEEEIFDNSRPGLSNLRNVLEEAMLENPTYWKSYYTGSGEKIRIARKYSFFDRSRYYWGDNKVKESLDRLLKNLGSVEIPLSIIGQFFPIQYKKIREGLIKPDPVSLIEDRISNVFDDYSYAVE